VWIGRDDNGKMPLTGGTGALQIWSDTMAGLNVGSASFVKPDGVEYFWVEPHNQSLSREGCAGARYLPYMSGSEPSIRGSCFQRPGQEVVDWFKDLFGSE